MLAHKPRVVVIQFGINDAAVDVWKTPPATVPRTDLKTFEADLRFFVAECRRTGAMVLLLTPNPLQWADVTRKLYGKPPYNVEDSDGFNVVLKEYAQAVRRISASQRPVILADVEGFAYKEIAEMLDIPIGTVMSRLHRGRKAMQKALHDYALERGLVAARSAGTDGNLGQDH